MLITRKIGKLIRGKATPFQIYAACLLGALLGFLPGFQQAPALTLLWIFLLLILNANIFLAGIVTLLSKLVLLAAMPVVFQIGRLLIESPLQGMFKAIVNAPVGAYSGLDYYAVAGGQLVAVIVGVGLGWALARALQRYRRKMRDLSENSERMKKYSEKKTVKFLKFVFLGGGRGKKSYDELMASRIGNPVRIWGVAVVVLFGGALAFGLNALSEPLITSLAKSGLESANGATVDLESADISFKEGKLEASGLAMADPQQLDTNLFEAARVVADFSGADLLRKRFSIDRLTIEEGAAGRPRATPGELVGPKAEARQKPEDELPEFADLDTVLKNSEVWKNRLAQVKQWLERLGSDGEPEDKKGMSWEKQLNSRIQALGHAHVKAEYLTEGSPTFWIRRLEAKGVKTPYLDGIVVDILGDDLSTHPLLAKAAPKLHIASRDERLDARLNLAGASGTGTNQANFKLLGYPVDRFAAALKDDGEAPLSGGTMDVDLSGRIGALNNDLVAKVTFDGTMARISGNSVDLDGVSLPLNIKGPLDRPGVKLEGDALKNVLVSAGKKKLFEKAAEELGVESAEEGEKQDAGNLLKGLIKKKLDEE